MENRKIIVRSDDLDPRIRLDDLKYIHSLFLANDIPFTIAVNNIMGSNYNFRPEVIDYINATQGWDIQLHGYSHDHLWYMDRKELFQNLFTNLYLTKQTFIYSNPTVLYPPWNEGSQVMQEVCNDLGLKLHTTGVHIRFYVKWKRQTDDCVFIHWWDLEDLKLLPELFSIIKGPGSQVVLPKEWQDNQ